MQSQSGIILKKIPYGDADEILTVLLKEDGVQRFFVAGSRKSKKKYQGLIDHFAHLKLQYMPSHKGLWRLTGVDIDDSSSIQVWRKMEAFAIGSFFAELIHELMPEAVHDHRLFDLWLDLQSRLGSGENILLAAAQAFLHLFEITGYALELRSCVVCENILNSEIVALDVLRGGVTCSLCESPAARPEDKVSKAFLNLLCSDDAEQNKVLSSELGVYFRFITAFAQQVMQKKSRAAPFFLATLVK